MENTSIPYVAHEATMARMERGQKRLWVVVILLVLLLVGSNVAWMVYESQFEGVEIVQENDDGYNNFVGNDGDIYNGETDNKIP